ncbi:MAG: hypothetical protein RR460_04305 [Clostridium sp.]
MLLSKPNRFYELKSKEVDIVIDLEEVSAILSVKRVQYNIAEKECEKELRDIGVLLRGLGDRAFPPIRIEEHKNFNEEIKKFIEAWTNYKLLKD